jgi:NADPH:quinone reductase-like Zn-dependent oxidoreductase
MLGHITAPAAEGGLERRELADPRPGPSDIVVAVRAYSVNRGELALLLQRPDGWTPGQDVAGIVARAAENGSGPGVGARVVGLADAGGWSERVAVPAHRTAELPDDVSFPDAAALPVAGLTALRALRAGGGLLGRSVLVTGASGGVGTLALQLAKTGGAHVTALVSGPPRVDAVRSLGADAVAMTLDADAGPFDVVLDGVGGDVLVGAVRRLAREGVVVAYGLASGEPSRLSFRDFGEAAFGRLLPFRVYATGESTFGKDLGFLAALVGRGRLRPVIGAELHWSRTVEGIESLRERRVAGKVVFTLDR